MKLFLTIYLVVTLVWFFGELTVHGIMMYGKEFYKVYALAYLTMYHLAGDKHLIVIPWALLEILTMPIKMPLIHWSKRTKNLYEIGAAETNLKECIKEAIDEVNG